MPKMTWETLVAPKIKKDAQPGVRRVGVPGGYLYQVEHHVDVEDGHITWVEWFAPVFVPFYGDGDGS